MKAEARSEIEDKIKNLLASELNIDPAAVLTSGSDTPLLGHGIGLDSVEALRLVVAVENEFDIQVADSDLATRLFANIGTFAEYIWRKISGESSGRDDPSILP